MIKLSDAFSALIWGPEWQVMSELNRIDMALGVAVQEGRITPTEADRQLREHMARLAAA